METQYENLMRNTRRLQGVYERAIAREDYDLALRATNSIDHICARYGVDLLDIGESEEPVQDLGDMAYPLRSRGALSSAETLNYLSQRSEHLGGRGPVGGVYTVKTKFNPYGEIIQ